MIEIGKVRFVLAVVSTVLYFLILISIPFRTKFILSKAGKKIVGGKIHGLFLPILIMVCSFLLIFVVYFKELSFIVDLITCLVGLLGAAMGSEEAALSNIGGLYENGLVGTGHYLPLKEIYHIKEFDWSQEDWENSDKRVFHVVTDKKGTVPFVCTSEEECKEMLDVLKKILQPS